MLQNFKTLFQIAFFFSFCNVLWRSNRLQPGHANE